MSKDLIAETPQRKYANAQNVSNIHRDVTRHDQPLPCPNQSNYNPAICTLQIYPLIYTYLIYDPSFAGNALFLIFALLRPMQIFLELHYLISRFLVTTFPGLSIEIIGGLRTKDMQRNT
ncbi:hypothetical protein N431DRAFT_469157 [Stipitochalara longipes BDJ]|nr:hypothetical protein N431DRAFT_469157 [Stipitochalara longipes BDJ]